MRTLAMVAWPAFSLFGRGGGRPELFKDARIAV
jgi:hypothetical protein